MSSKNITIVIVLLSLAAAGLWLRSRDGAAEPESTSVAVAKSSQASSKSLSTPKSMGSGARRRGLDVRYEDDPAGSLRLEGQVVTADRAPASGATVVLNSRPPRTTTTAEDGSFFFDKLVARNYELAARSPDGAAGPVAARLSESNDPVILVLGAGGDVRVQVSAAGVEGGLAGATVELRGIAVRSMTANAEGVASFSQVPLDRFEVVASAAGYASQRSRVILSRAGASAEVSLLLKKGAPVSGTVIDDEGQPVSGARVVYRGASNWSLRADPRLDFVLSAADGGFKIAALPKGSFRFTAKAEGHAEGTSKVVQHDGENETSGVEVRMQPSATLHGVVLSVSGTPVVAASVRVAPKSAGVARSRSSLRQVYTDEQGRYSIGELSRRVHEVVAVHESGSSAIVLADLSKAPHDLAMDLTLSIEGAIAGVVVDSQGEPIAGAQVTLFPDFRKGSGRSASDWRMRGLSSEVTDAGGLFRISGLPPATDYRVRAVPGASNSPGRTWLSDGEDARTGDTNVRIVLPADGGIRGKVSLANGSAPEMFTVSVGWQNGTPFSTKDGHFELPDLPPKSFTLIIKGPGIDEKRVANVIVEEGVFTDVGTISVSKGRTITGTVLGPDGSPVEGATVSAGRIIFGDGSSAKAAGGSRNPLARGTKSVTSGENGQFTLYGVVTGDLSIVADHETIGRSMPISVQMSRDSIEGISLQLQKTGSLEGVVRKNGEPEDGVVVTATSVKFPGVTFNVSSGADGRYRFDRLIADTYRVKAMFGANPMVGMAFVAEQASVTADSVASLDISFVDSGVMLRVILTSEGGLGFSWLTVVGPEVQAATARELQAAQASSTGFESMGMSIRGRPGRATNVQPGRHQLCAIVYPTEVKGMDGTMEYSEREGDNLPAQCMAFEVPENSDGQEQEITMPVVVPEFVPKPEE